MPVPPALRSLWARLPSMRYGASADAADRRDLRIDLLRGLCVVVMIVDHVGGEPSWLYTLTGGNRAVISAAEGFVLLSGISMGLVHRGTIERLGPRGMLAKVLGRAWLLYALTVILTIGFAAASGALGTPWSAAAVPAASGSDFALSVASLQRSYSLADILLLYTLLVLAAGPVLWLIAYGRTALVLVASWTIWAAAQVWPGGAPQPWPILDGGFPLASWQVVFVSGLAVGYHRDRVGRWATTERLIAVAALAGVALVLVRAVGATSSMDVQQLLFDKDSVQIGRLLGLAEAASVAAVVTTLAWMPLRRWTGWLLLPLGQRALFAYTVQLFVVAFWWAAPIAPLRLDGRNELAQLAAVGMVWAACVTWPRFRRSKPPVRVPFGPSATSAPRFATGAALVLPVLLAISAASVTGMSDLLAPAPSVAAAADAVVTPTDDAAASSATGAAHPLWRHHYRGTLSP